MNNQYDYDMMRALILAGYVDGYVEDGSVFPALFWRALLRVKRFARRDEALRQLAALNLASLPGSTVMAKYTA